MTDPCKQLVVAEVGHCAMLAPLCPECGLTPWRCKCNEEDDEIDPSETYDRPHLLEPDEWD